MTFRPAFLVTLVLAFPAFAEDITGPARVIDGDTIEVADERIRLYGTEAPEKAHRLTSCSRGSLPRGQRCIETTPLPR